MSLLDPNAVREEPGPAWALAFTSRVDKAIADNLAGFLSTSGHRSGGVAIIALGSYARRALCPRSDIDLLLLHDGWGGNDLQSFVQSICYPLWDAGLSVGHAVRTSKEAIRATADSVDSATALTDRRLVAGSNGLADDLSARVARWLRRAGGNLAQEIADADAARHRRYGRTAGALEPDLKDGIGGLRDIHSLRWAGAIVLGEAGLDPLVGARYLGATDRAEIAAAGEILLSARIAVHQVAGRTARNQLRLDLQDEVGAHMGMADGDVLLQRVGLAMRTVSHLHARTWPKLLQDARRGRRRRRGTATAVGDGLVLDDGLIEVEADQSLRDRPSLGLEAVAAAAEHSTVIGRASAMRLRREIEKVGQLRWDDTARDALVRLLSSGDDGLPAMSDADYLGLWQAHLPEWSRVRGLPQRNPLHTYDVDTHAMQTVANLAAVARGDHGPHHVAVWQELEDPTAAVLGAWLHDVGKAWPGDHSVGGETVARDWMLHMGFPGKCADRVAKIVRLHLLLPDTATQRDIDDLGEIERAAVLIGDIETLNALYLLAWADSRATGKAAWSEWKDLLITGLYDRVRGVLQGDIGVLVRPEVSDVVIRAAARQGVEEAAVRHTVDGLPSRYLRVASTEQIAAHTRLHTEQPSGLLVDVRDGPTSATQTLSLAAPDRRGMVADLLGVLAAHRIDVHEARVFTHDNGMALDWFVVSAAGDGEWAKIAPELQRAYDGALDIDQALERRERSRDARPPALAAPVPITVSTSPSGSATRVEVRGPDSPGVLYRLTSAISGLGLSLLGARIATLGPEVRDSFFVRGAIPAPDVLEKALRPAFDSADG